MFRDLIISSVGHAIVFGSLVIASFFGEKPIIPKFDIYRVRTVTPQSISELLKKVDTVEKPKSNVPQIQTKTKTLPQKHRKKSQTVNRSKKSNSTSVTKTKSSTPEGMRTDSEIDNEYLLELQERISQNWRPPGISTKTTVYFKIRKDGKIVRLQVKERSGNKRFDMSAFNAVRASDPVPPLPDDFKNDNLGVYLDFIYEND